MKNNRLLTKNLQSQKEVGGSLSSPAHPVQRFVMRLFGWRDVKTNPPQECEFVIISLMPKMHALYSGEGLFIHQGRDFYPRWFKPYKGGDHLIRAIEERKTQPCGTHGL